MTGSIASLDEPLLVGEHGAKAARLATARRAGLSVPPGLALTAGLVERLTHGDQFQLLATAIANSLRFPLAVRSSALDEATEAASFAGQHASVLGVRDFAAVVEALRAVAASVRAPSPAGYRARLGMAPETIIAVLIQELVPAEVAGVLFTADPVSGSGERMVVEAAFGLGEVVVGGLVTPDRYVLARDGHVLQSVAGPKELTIVAAPRGGTTTRAGQRPELCLGPLELRQLVELGARCEELFAGPQDVEWAFAGGRLHLLQSRPITTLPNTRRHADSFRNTVPR